MLYDIERTIRKLDKNSASDEYKDLVYDLESFIIDIAFDEESENENPEKQSYLGKLELVNQVRDKREGEKVFSKIRPILVSLGIHEGVKGFRLIEACALEAARQKLSVGDYRMKDVYGVVAKHYSINAHNCERLCRYACLSVNPDRAFAQKYPFFEELTHRTYENVTVKELVDLLVRYVLSKCSIRLRQNDKL